MIYRYIQDFVNTYPEFSGIVDDEKHIKNLENTFNKIMCLYPQFKNLNDCRYKYVFFMLLAHYFVIQGFAVDFGILPTNGIISSSSIDSVSISMQNSPYNNDFSYFFGQTKYGQEYLNYLSQISGLQYVN